MRFGSSSNERLMRPRKWTREPSQAPTARFNDQFVLCWNSISVISAALGQTDGDRRVLFCLLAGHRCGQHPASAGKNILAGSEVGCAERLMEPVFAGPSWAREISQWITVSGTSDPLTSSGSGPTSAARQQFALPGASRVSRVQRTIVSTSFVTNSLQEPSKAVMLAPD